MKTIKKLFTLVLLLVLPLTLSGCFGGGMFDDEDFDTYGGRDVASANDVVTRVLFYKYDRNTKQISVGSESENENATQMIKPEYETKSYTWEPNRDGYVLHFNKKDLYDLFKEGVVGISFDVIMPKIVNYNNNNEEVIDKTDPANPVNLLNWQVEVCEYDLDKNQPDEIINNKNGTNTNKGLNLIKVATAEEKTTEKYGKHYKFSFDFKNFEREYGGTRLDRIWYKSKANALLIQVKPEDGRTLLDKTDWENQNNDPYNFCHFYLENIKIVFNTGQENYDTGKPYKEWYPGATPNERPWDD